MANFGVIALIIALIVASSVTWYYKTHEATQTRIDTLYSEQGAVILDRSNKQLTEMPREILSQTKLRELNLSHNSLTGALPAEIRQLQNLEVLNISDNHMTGLPAEIGQLSHLRVLNAAHNNLTGIPHELGNLQKLEVLNLSGNAISPQDIQSIRAKLPASTQILL